MKTQLKAKKHLGQNFLVNKHHQNRVLVEMQKIVNTKPELPIVEIGVGQGDLTIEFAKWGRELKCLEIDTSAYDLVQSKLQDSPNFEMHLCDALQEISKKPNYFPSDFVLLSSLPYNVGSRILVDMAVEYPHINLAVILQREVGQKVLAKDITFFGAFLKLFWTFRNLHIIPPSAFLPQPKVYSILISGISKETNYTHKERDFIKNVLKRLFVSPNKTLSNNMHNLGMTKEQIDNFFEKHNLPKSTRMCWDNYKQNLELVILELNLLEITFDKTTK